MDPFCSPATCYKLSVRCWKNIIKIRCTDLGEISISSAIPGHHSFFIFKSRLYIQAGNLITHIHYPVWINWKFWFFSIITQIVFSIFSVERSKMRRGWGWEMQWGTQLWPSHNAMLMAHLPKENLLFIVAQCLKGSIYFKNWMRPSCTSNFLLGPIFYYLLHKVFLLHEEFLSTLVCPVNLWHSFPPQWAALLWIQFCSSQTKISSEMSFEAASPGLPRTWELSFPPPWRAAMIEHEDQNEGQGRNCI